METERERENGRALLCCFPPHNKIKLIMIIIPGADQKKKEGRREGEDDQKGTEREREKEQFYPRLTSWK